MSRLTALGIGFGFAALGAVTPSLADGYPPFYGYSSYLGRPAVYYSRDLDVQQSTRPVAGELGFGVTTYTTGGPFFGYKAARTLRHPVRRHREVLRVRG